MKLELSLKFIQRRTSMDSLVKRKTRLFLKELNKLSSSS